MFLSTDTIPERRLILSICYMLWVSLLPGITSAKTMTENKPGLTSGTAELKFIETGSGLKPLFTYSSDSVVSYNGEKPIALWLKSTGITKWYYAFYDSVKYNASHDTVCCYGEIESDNGTHFQFSDIYTAGEQEASFHIARDLKILTPNPADRSFNSSMGFNHNRISSMTDYEFFAPGIWYKDSRYLPPHALAFDYNDNYFLFREDRMPLPLITMRNKSAGVTISLLHTGGNPETFYGEDGLNEICDERIQFGSIGVQHFNKTSVVFLFPGSEGEKTYVYGGSTAKRWSLRSHPVKYGINHSYDLVLSFSETSSFEEAIRQSWQRAFELENPPIHYVDLQNVYENQIDLLNTYWASIEGAPGLPFSVYLPDGDPRLYSYNMGFIGMQIPCGYYMLREGLETNNQQLIDKGSSIIDWWAENSLTETGNLRTWVDPPNNWRSFYHTFLRVTSSGMEGALYAYSIMKKHGIEKPEWLEYCITYADWLIRNQNPDGSYYLSYDYTTDLPSHESKFGTSNPIRFLLELYLVTADKKYLTTALKAADFSYRNIHENYGYVGSVIDNPNVLDRESGQMALYAFLTLFDVTGDNKWLDAAIRAAEYTETWIFSWDIPIPAGTPDPAFPVHKDCTGLAIIASGHSAADNGISYNAFQYYRLYLLTGNDHFLQIAKLILHNAKQTMDWDGSLGYAHPGLQTEAQQVCIPRGSSVMQWLPWNTAANLDPMFRFKDAFGTMDIDEIQDLPLEQRISLNNAYGKTRGLATGLSPVSSVVPAYAAETPFELEVFNPAGREITYHIVTNPVSGNIQGTAPDLVYSKQDIFNGSDSLSFCVQSDEGFSDTVWVYFDGKAPYPPENIEIKAVSHHRIRLEWSEANIQGWHADRFHLCPLLCRS